MKAIAFNVIAIDIACLIPVNENWKKPIVKKKNKANGGLVAVRFKNENNDMQIINADAINND